MNLTDYKKNKDKAVYNWNVLGIEEEECLKMKEKKAL